MAPLEPEEFRVLSEVGTSDSSEVIDTPDANIPILERLYDSGLVGPDPFEDCLCVTARGEMARRIHLVFLASTVTT